MVGSETLIMGNFLLNVAARIDGRYEGVVWSRGYDQGFEWHVDASISLQYPPISADIENMERIVDRMYIPGRVSVYAHEEYDGVRISLFYNSGDFDKIDWNSESPQDYPDWLSKRSADTENPRNYAADLSHEARQVLYDDIFIGPGVLGDMLDEDDIIYIDETMSGVVTAIHRSKAEFTHDDEMDKETGKPVVNTYPMLIIHNSEGREFEYADDNVIGSLDWEYKRSMAVQDGWETARDDQVRIKPSEVKKLAEKYAQKRFDDWKQNDKYYRLQVYGDGKVSEYKELEEKLMELEENYDENEDEAKEVYYRMEEIIDGVDAEEWNYWYGEYEDGLTGSNMVDFLVDDDYTPYTDRYEVIAEDFMEYDYDDMANEWVRNGGGFFEDSMFDVEYGAGGSWWETDGSTISDIDYEIDAPEEIAYSIHDSYPYWLSKTNWMNKTNVDASRIVQFVMLKVKKGDGMPEHEWLEEVKRNMSTEWFRLPNGKEVQGDEYARYWSNEYNEGRWWLSYVRAVASVIYDDLDAEDYESMGCGGCDIMSTQPIDEILEHNIVDEEFFEIAEQLKGMKFSNDFRVYLSREGTTPIDITEKVIHYFMKPQESPQDYPDWLSKKRDGVVDVDYITIKVSEDYDPAVYDWLTELSGETDEYRHLPDGTKVTGNEYYEYYVDMYEQGEWWLSWIRVTFSVDGEEDVEQTVGCGGCSIMSTQSIDEILNYDITQEELIEMFNMLKGARFSENFRVYLDADGDVTDVTNHDVVEGIFNMQVPEDYPDWLSKKKKTSNEFNESISNINEAYRQHYIDELMNIPESDRYDFLIEEWGFDEDFLAYGPWVQPAESMGGVKVGTITPQQFVSGKWGWREYGEYRIPNDAVEEIVDEYLSRKTDVLPEQEKPEDYPDWLSKRKNNVPLIVEVCIDVREEHDNLDYHEILMAAKQGNETAKHLVEAYEAGLWWMSRVETRLFTIDGLHVAGPISGDFFIDGAPMTPEQFFNNECVNEQIEYLLADSDLRGARFSDDFDARVVVEGEVPFNVTKPFLEKYVYGTYMEIPQDYPDWLSKKSKRAPKKNITIDELAEGIVFYLNREILKPFLKAQRNWSIPGSKKGVVVDDVITEFTLAGYGREYVSYGNELHAESRDLFVIKIRYPHPRSKYTGACGPYPGETVKSEMYRTFGFGPEDVLIERDKGNLYMFIDIDPNNVVERDDEKSMETPQDYPDWLSKMNQ